MRTDSRRRPGGHTELSSLERGCLATTRLPTAGPLPLQDAPVGLLFLGLFPPKVTLTNKNHGCFLVSFLQG